MAQINSSKFSDRKCDKSPQPLLFSPKKEHPPEYDDDVLNYEGNHSNHPILCDSCNFGDW